MSLETKGKITFWQKVSRDKGVIQKLASDGALPRLFIHRPL